MTGMMHMVMIYVERENKYILKRRNEDGGAKLVKQRWRSHLTNM